jgi:hypothetical protein
MAHFTRPARVHMPCSRSVHAHGASTGLGVTVGGPLVTRAPARDQRHVAHKAGSLQQCRALLTPLERVSDPHLQLATAKLPK